MFQTWIKQLSFIVLIFIPGVLLLSDTCVAAQDRDQGVYQAAAGLYQEKSYQLALEKYKTLLLQSGLTPDQKREATFKVADCSWRIGNPQLYPEASLALKQMVIADDHDRWWAEANQSLAEFFTQHDRYSHQETIKKLLMSAREFWSGDADTVIARPRFIRATFDLANHITNNWGWQLESSLQDIQPRKEDELIPLPEHAGSTGIKELMQDILKVADKAEDKAQATYMLAMGNMALYSDDGRKSAEQYFNTVIKDYSTTEWADDAYYQLALMYEQRQDFVKAVSAYKALLEAFKPGTSQFIDEAKQHVDQITAPVIQPWVAYNFLPDSPVRFSLNTRNINNAEFTFYKMDLTEELRPDPAKADNVYDRGVEDYNQLLKIMVDTKSYERLPVALTFHRPIKDEGKHIPFSQDKGLGEWQMPDDKAIQPDAKSGILAPGAYLLMVKSGKTCGYDLVIVSNLGLAVRTAGRSAVFFAFDTTTGKSKLSAKVKYHYRYYDKGNYRLGEGSGITDDDGILKVDLKTGEQNNYNQHQVFAVVSDGINQAFCQSDYNYYSQQRGEYWLYAFTDRPAYRPQETISFKGTVRQNRKDTFVTPGGMQVKALIYDARGTKIFEKVYTLNDFGSFNDVLMLDDKAALGQYRLDLYTGDGNTHLAQASLFRLEEYKLPEFKVAIQPKAKGDGPFAQAYRLGDKITLDLDAQYYFGGPVPNAKVEYLIYEKQDYHVYYPDREYDWYYTADQRNNYYENGLLIKKGEVVTDGQGKAQIEFDTDKTKGQNLAYHIEGRVVDSSRREITASADIKVSLKSFFIYQTPRRNLYRPGDKVEIDIKALTANEAPVSMDGKVVVSRHGWGGKGDDLFTKFIKTDAKGQAVFEFSPDQNGYYSVAVTGFDVDSSPIESLSNIYVCDKQANDIGYRYSGLQVIAEKDTYRVGETMRLMLVADKPGASVLLSTEADEIASAQLVRMDGPVKLIEIPVNAAFTPNIFVSAASPVDQQIRLADLELIVPPEDHFLNVKLTSDKPVYGPGEAGELGVEVTDQKNQPVAAELALSLVDASVFYIQSELAGDIRQFFFGEKRSHSVQFQSSLYQRPFFKAIPDNIPGMNEETGSSRLVGSAVYADQLAENAVGSNIRDLNKGYIKAKRGLEGAVARKVLKAPMSAGVSDRKEALMMPLASAAVRQDFRSTVFWGPSITSDSSGKARVSVKFPDSLTTWRATARAITKDTDIGNTTAEMTTKKDIIVRLQAPRFFTEHDKVTISANVHNYTLEKQHVKVSLKVQAVNLDSPPEVWVDVDAAGEQRVDWMVRADKAGLAELTAMAQTATISDAMMKTYPVVPHGLEKFIARSLALKTDAQGGTEGEFTFDVPKERIPESTALRLTLSPSMAAGMLDALPYLADYPYGCVEQTMSRFLPSVIVAKTMRDLGFDAKDVDHYLPYTRLNDITQASLNRLYDFQHADGGWGWWKGGDSDRFMTAYVVWGMALARDAGIDIRHDLLARAGKYLGDNLVQEENDPDMLAWMLHAMAYAKYAGPLFDQQVMRLWDMREKLNPYTRALFAIAQKINGKEAEAQVLARNMANGMMMDNDNQTAHWGEAGMNYRWSEGGVEATAFSLKALVNIDPQSQWIAPAVKWLSLNRRGTTWKNTRDTAIAILALADYLKVSGELTPDYDYDVLVNGKSVQQGHVNAANMFTFDRYIDLPAEAVKSGLNKVQVKVKGKGSLYVSAYLKYFTLEENIKPEGNEVFVTRKYFRQAQKETLLKGYVEDWKPLVDGDTLKSGDRVKVELTVEAKNNYEYLIFEDPKPAGLEAVELKSGDGFIAALDKKGNPDGGKAYLYQEFRDQKAVFFVDKLKQGRHCINYELRAEIPGDFHAMPHQAQAMYVPEIRANSAEGRLGVAD
ncbi:MAG: alpha-2-macroglobulin family protein [Candidatus Omnitrophota bacterium]